MFASVYNFMLGDRYEQFGTCLSKYLQSRPAPELSFTENQELTVRVGIYFDYTTALSQVRLWQLSDVPGLPKHVKIEIVPLWVASSTEDLVLDLRSANLDFAILSGNNLLPLAPEVALAGFLGNLNIEAKEAWLQEENNPFHDSLASGGLSLHYYCSTGEGTGRWQSFPSGTSSSLNIEYYPTPWFTQDLLSKYNLQPIAPKQGLSPSDRLDRGDINLTLSRPHLENWFFQPKSDVTYVLTNWLSSTDSLFLVENSHRSGSETDWQSVKRAFQFFGEAVGRSLGDLGTMAIDELRKQGITVTESDVELSQVMPGFFEDMRSLFAQQNQACDRTMASYQEHVLQQRTATGGRDEI